MGRTFVMGDIHGSYKALVQCLERSGFQMTSDRLICLGDVCDRGPETKACIDLLMGIPNLVYVMGNHDAWALEWMSTKMIDPSWAKQGGLATVRSYEAGVPESHLEFLGQASLYHIEQNRLFVHAGIEPGLPLNAQPPDVFLWDRELGRTVLNAYLNKSPGRLTEYREIFIGHTPVPFRHPIQAFEVWMMDTGAGWSGVLSMMNVETKEVIASDPVGTLYV